MVYNALKLFMEINPDLFDESMHQYKQHKLESVQLWLGQFVVHSPLIKQGARARPTTVQCVVEDARTGHEECSWW